MGTDADSGRPGSVSICLTRFFGTSPVDGVRTEEVLRVGTVTPVDDPPGDDNFC